MSNPIKTRVNSIVANQSWMMSLLAAAAIGGGMSLARPALAAYPAPGIYRVATITNHKQLAGNYASQTKARFAGTLIQINADGTFVTAELNTWYTTMQGKLVKSGSGYSFQANRSISFGYTGGSATALEGTLKVVNGKVQMTLSSRSGSTLAAVINKMNFGSSVSSAWIGTATIQRIK